MCGIVGYVGSDQAAPVLIEGLRRLEYRGYDSAGMSILDGGGRLATVKAPGKLRMLEARLAETPLRGSCGIGHTRWATHGAPSTANAHPHTSTDGTIAVVHNGIIENARRLRQDLEAAGAVFRSETDTEVIAHLVDRVWPEGGALEDAVAGALGRITGAYGIAVVSSRDPDKIVVARHGSPLLVGIGEREMMVASDASAVIGHTRNVIYLDDGDYVVVQPDGYRARHLHLGSVHRPIHTVTWDVRAVGKGGYEHFMLKEIFEQPKTLEDVMRGRLLGESGDARLGGITGAEQVLQDVERVILTACGTSWHAALIGEYMLEELARIPTKVEYASEFRYKNPVVDRKTLIVAISQSGETADTLAAIREAKRRGAPLMGIVNVVGSSIARETDFGMYLHAGPEIGVASTKAFTSQVAALAMFTLHLARCRSLPLVAGRELVRSLRSLPEQVEEILRQNDAIRALAEEFRDAPNFLYLGRGVQFPVALEGALKLKEVSYIHAEGYPAAEMKHGPIALIDAQMPVVFLAPRDPVYHKVVSNIEEVKARSGRIVAVVNNGAAELADKVDHFIPVPTTHPALLPILTVVPLQLLAYHISVLRDCDVDQPRNLAKSVTVE
ncbi:MAG: glutamine--fructose-6-phosphate transaminase (isomerizing) [Gammaproteobacteria bacterium]|nr:glutamine--fructose-6-phosphate transaminase (isomerizing) [Gammaproteobacteria bacterium]